MNLSLTPVWLAVYGRPTVCTSGAREWSYIAVPLRPHACLSLQFGCVTRVRIPQIFMKNALRLVAPLYFRRVCPFLLELQSCSQTDSVVGGSMKFFTRILVASVLFVAFISAAPAWAQTANSAIVLGMVTDPGGAVVPDATVSLTNTATNEIKTTATNSSGQYVFPNVSPGIYTLKISKVGFATTTFSSIQFNVSKSYTYDAKLEVSSTKEIIEVTAGAVAELQTTDAVMGNVVGGTMLMRLPTLGRDASELLTLQPGSTPYDSSQVGLGNNGGTIAGARSAQTSIGMDGIDVTDNVISGGATEKPIIPIGVGSVDEFRAEITNENVTFLRSSGGQVAIVSKSGGNTYHGSVYWLHQNSALNANSWDNNRNKLKKPPTHDNRDGVWIA